jgi:hypothetical protein
LTLPVSDVIAGSQREYIHWLIETCSKGETKPAAILAEDAIDLLATKLRTPLQIQQHLTLAQECGLPNRREARCTPACRYDRGPDGIEVPQRSLDGPNIGPQATRPSCAT